MPFLNNIWLWGALGLVGVAVPIIIHLINRFRQRKIDWAAMELLRRAISIRSRQIRLEDLLLLVLRCLAMLLIALALGRPTVSVSGESGVIKSLLIGKERPGVVIAVDASMSMAHSDTGVTRFDKARQRVKEVLGTLEPGDRVTLLLLGDRVHPLLRNESFQKERYEKALDAAVPLPEGLNLETCLDELEKLVTEVTAASRECYVVSDSQVLTWKGLSDTSRRRFQSIGAAGVKLYYLPVGSEGCENLAVTHLQLASGSLQVGRMVRYEATIHNFGRKTQQATVTLLAGGAKVDRVVEPLDREQSKTVSLYYWCQRPGDVRLTAHLDPDPLAMDNDCHAVAHVRDRINVLCVTALPPEGLIAAADTPGSPTFYLAASLIPKGEEPNQSLVITPISVRQLTAQALSKADVVVMLDPPEVPAESAAALRGFVEQGGGLIAFAGDQTDRRFFNIKPQDGGLSPAELIEVMRASMAPTDVSTLERPEFWNVEPIRPTSPGGTGGAQAGAAKVHPLLRGIERLPDKLMEEARFQQYFKARPYAESDVLLRVAGTEDPLLIQRNVGRGKVLLLTTTADRSWGDLAIHPIFPILLNQAMTYLTVQPNERPVVVGESFALPLTKFLAQRGLPVPSTVTLRSPSGEESPLTVSRPGGKPVVTCDKVDQTEFYEIWLKEKGGPTPRGAETPILVAANVNPIESDVAALDANGLTGSLGNLPVTVLPEGVALDEVIRESRVGRELWRELILLALAVLLLESFLARHFTRRMSIDEGESVPSGAASPAKSAIDTAA